MSKKQRSKEMKLMDCLHLRIQLFGIKNRNLILNVFLTTRICCLSNDTARLKAPILQGRENHTLSYHENVK